MTYLSGPHLVWVLLIPAAVSSLRLLSYPDVATQDEGFTLSCVKDSNDLITAAWIRNKTIVFNTRSDVQKPTVSHNYQMILTVLERVTVNASLRQHNVTLRINSTLDDGSVWLCGQGGVQSNNLTIHVREYTTVGSTFQTTTMLNVQTPTSTDSSIDTTKDVQSKKTSLSTAGLSREQNDPDYIPVIVGIVAGTVFVASIVLVTVLCVQRHRNIRKQDTTTAEIPEYSTMSRDYDTDNHYTQLDPRLNQSGNESTQDTPTDVYYNTVSKGSDSYENPPLHQSI